jgi:SNF2 family DNA or RNA helicase
MAIKLMAHQKRSVKFLDSNDKVFDMSDPGTGKTIVQITDVQATNKKAKHKTLIFAPKSLLRSAWDNDFSKAAPTMTRSIATAANRAKALAVDSDVYITNHDAAVQLAKMPASFWKKFAGGTLIIDESSAFKHRTSSRSKAMAKISRNFKRVRLMSGTPSTNTICDLWHQVFILDQGKRLGTSFFNFRSAVCTPTQIGPQPQMVEWRDKPNSSAVVSALISDITIRNKFEDCVDIPPNHQYSMPFHLNSKHFKSYKELENTSILELNNEKTTAVNGAVLYTKLLQASSGAIYNDAGAYTLIDYDRYNLVIDLVSERTHSIVFFNWQHQRDKLVEIADLRGLKYAVIDGQVSSKERERIVEDYQKGFYDVLFAHPQSAGHGLTLTKGVATIFASPTHNLEHYLQALKRIHRIGQTEKTETICIVAPGTIEEDVYANMLAKDARMTDLLTLLKNKKIK